MSAPFVILGGGGHARVVLGLLNARGLPVAGFVAPQQAVPVGGVTRLGDDDWLSAQPPSAYQLANGVGSVGDVSLRRRLYDRFTAAGFGFPALVHPAAWCAEDVQLHAGAQVMAGAVVQPGSELGANAIVNTGASVDHDCRIGAHAHISPGATLCGAVIVGAGAHVGAGATVMQGLTIGEGALVAGGAVVVREVAAGATVRGVPAGI